MVEFEPQAAPLREADAEVLVVTATRQGEGDEAAAAIDAAAEELAGHLDLDVAEVLGGLDFDGSVGTTARIPTRGRAAARTLLVVGLGPADEAGTDAVRRAGAAVASATSRLSSAAVALPQLADTAVGAAAVAQALVEGIRLGSYAFAGYRSEPDEHQLTTVTLHGEDTESVARGIAIGRATSAAAALARDLVNLPPADKRPSMLAARAEQELEGSGVTIEVLGPEELEDGGYGGLIGVGRGSSDGPRLVKLSYVPEGAASGDAPRHVALVGKGITFDSGGLSLKPSEAMETMKMDMGGAAAVLATVRAAAELRLPVRVTGLMALAENMPSGSATRPGDVLTIRGGKTVEVLNTDAEGRLVLADALVDACALEPDVVVDLATLTGAAKIALGERIGVLMSSDDELADALLEAGRRSGEPFWRLPVATAEYREKLDSEVADIKNVGGREAGTITAGLFLHEFVAEGVPWAHLDIAGVAWSDRAEGYVKKGGTGTPVRLLVHWLAAG